MKDINAIKDIVHIIYELTITICTIIIAWPKIKKHFRERKKNLEKQIIFNSKHQFGIYCNKEKYIWIN